MKSVITKASLAVGALSALIYAGCSPVSFAPGQSSCTSGGNCIIANSGNSVTETLTFTSSNKVDILIVDDNSGSMQYEQNNMVNYFGNAISALNAKNFDYQIGVTTTDICPSSDAGPNFCSSSDVGARGQFVGQGSASFGPQNILAWSPTNQNANIDQEFNLTIQRPETLASNVNQIASGDERAIYALNLAVDQYNTNDAGFFRDDANLAVIILSDEDERSVGGCEGAGNYSGCTSDPGYAPLASQDEPQSFVDSVNNIFGSTKSTMVNSIITVPGDSACLAVQQSQPPDYTGHYGYHYQALSNLVDINGNALSNTSGTNAGGNPLWMQGQVQSICANDFSTTMNNITAALVNMPVTNTMTLQYIPSATPTVTFTPQADAVNWTWTPGSNQIVFTARPPSGTTVTATYDYDASEQNFMTRLNKQAQPSAVNFNVANSQEAEQSIMTLWGQAAHLSSSNGSRD